MKKKISSSKKKLCTKGTSNENETNKQIPDEETIEPPSFFSLFRFASKFDKLLLITGVIFAIIAGALQPLSNLLFGNVTQDVFNYVQHCTDYSSEECKNATDQLMDDIRHFALWNSLLALTILITNYIAAETFNYAAIKQVLRLRSKYLKHLLNKDVAWYDLHKSGDFASRMADDLSKFEDGIGERVPLFIILQSTFFSSLIMALIKGWELALICLAALPITMTTVSVIVYLSTKFSKNELDAYGAAGIIAEEVLTSIKTVIGFGGQKIEMERYNETLNEAKKNNLKRHLFEAIGYGIIWLFVFSNYGLAFWFGVKFMLEDNTKYTPGNMITVFFSVMSGNMSFGISSPYFESFASAKAAAGKIFHITNTPPKINLSKTKGEEIDKVKGSIQLKNVKFRYPSRQDAPILQGLDLEIQPGETVALVGSSGCGKSTVLQLIQRFYDPDEGQVLIDGKNLIDLNLSKYRKFIGVVSQEPVLFDVSIEDNIRFGNEEATEDEIINASKMANAHNFINKLPDKYKAVVGERGAQLSGGQKQRIAIARALVRNPAILLLDEATSALDTNSEAKVQAALDIASQNRTTIIVAHRLSTIKGANKIVVISNGKVVEQGTHNDLMSLKNHYYTLVMTQVQSSQEVGSTNENKDESNDANQEIIEATENVEENEMYEQEADIDNFVKKASLWSLMKFNLPEWYYLMLGSLGGALMGFSMPLFAVLFGSILEVIQNSDHDYVRRKTEEYCIGFVLAGVLSFTATFLQMFMFGIAGQKLTRRIRSKMFQAMLSQEMGYFDRKENGVGALCAQLSNEAAQVQGATGQRIGAMMNSFATLVFALALALYYQWKLGLVTLLFFPIIVFATFIQRRQMSSENYSYRESLKKSTKIAVEAVGNFKTVVSLGCEELFYNLYLNELIPHIKKSLINTHGRAFILGFSRSIILFAYSACMFYGGYLIRDDHVPYANVIKVCQALIMGTVSIANSLAFTPNLEKGLIAAKRIMKLIHRIPKVKDSNDAQPKSESYGNIEYSKIEFSYPTRDNITVLKNLDLSILQGKTVALVGPSGCGKSTIIQMIERFYDPKSGNVYLDNSDIKTITLESLRSHLGIVSQEPCLFSRTIAANIAYGDNSRAVTKAEIIEAATRANAHNFISSLPLGYDTELGEKGSQLSGGQKQRIAIARALIRNPKVLLLDEATSALDVESEKVVQAALDKAKTGRTCITIAHRLSTIQDADMICVISDGRVAEHGTHKELIEKKGLYYRLHTLQTL